MKIGFSLVLAFLVLLSATLATDLCGNGIIDDGEECDDLSDKCCISCRAKVCESTATCLSPQGSCDSTTGFCSFVPLDEGELCWLGNCLGACVSGSCIPLDRETQSCPILKRDEFEPITIYLVTKTKQTGNILESCHQRIAQALDVEGETDVRRIAFTSTHRPYFVSNSTGPSFEIKDSETLKSGNVSPVALQEALSMINRAHSSASTIKKAVAILFMNMETEWSLNTETNFKSELQRSQALGLEIFWVSDDIKDSELSSLVLTQPISYHFRLVNSLESSFNVSNFFLGEGTANGLKRSKSSASSSHTCSKDINCKHLSDDCNEGICNEGSCEKKPSIFYKNGQRKACVNDDKCAQEAECVIKSVSSKNQGVCETKKLRDCSCLDDLDKCEEGVCNPRNGKCHVVKTDCDNHEGPCSEPNRECDPRLPCCDTDTCRWKPVESTCAKKAGHFDGMSQDQKLCLNNYCTRDHSCKTFPIADGQRCFDLRPHHKCNLGSCKEDTR